MTHGSEGLPCRSAGRGAMPGGSGVRPGPPRLGHLDAPELPGGVAAGDTWPVHGGAQLGRPWHSENGAGRAGDSLHARRRSRGSANPKLMILVARLNRSVPYPPISLFQGMIGGKKLRLVEFMKNKALFLKVIQTLLKIKHLEKLRPACISWDTSLKGPTGVQLSLGHFWNFQIFGV